MMAAWLHIWAEKRKGNGCVDWYSECESRAVEVGGVRVTLRFIWREGERT